MSSRLDRSPVAIWWRTIDRWFLAAFLSLMGLGILLSFAASPAVAERIGLWATFTDVVLAPLVVLIVVMGLYPKPFIERIEPAVDRLVRHVEANSDYVEPRVATEGEQIVPASERRADEHADVTSTDEGADHEGGE